MRVAVLSDIHGNLPALEAVLEQVAREKPNLIVVCGDVASGPLPVESLELLMDLRDAKFLHGNADRSLVAAYDGRAKPELPGPAADWGAGQLSRRHRDFLASFPGHVHLDIDGLGRVLFCHGSPRSDLEIMTAATPKERLLEFVGGANADVVVCGHTHMQFDRTEDGVRVVNPGSVGMPYGQTGAHWAMFGPDVAFRRTTYDLEAAARRIRQSSWPGALDFARDNVLSAPSVEEAMEFFSKHGGP
jgi:putative phosphoesterase